MPKVGRSRQFGSVPSVQSLGQQAGYVPDELLQIANYVWIGNGSPEGAVAAPVGSLYLQRDGAAGTSTWLKQSGGTGNTGWAATTTVFGLSNLVVNPGFETDTSGWTATNCTLARDTVSKRTGAASGKLTANAGPPATMSIQSATGTSGIAVVPGATYIAGGFVLTAVTSRSVTITITWYNSAGSSISTTTQSLSDSTTWEGLQVNDVAPSTAAYAAISFTITSPAASEVHNVDDIYFSRITQTIYTDELLTAPASFPRVHIYSADRSYIDLYAGVDGENQASIQTVVNNSGAAVSTIDLILKSPSPTAGDQASIVLRGGTTKEAYFNAVNIYSNNGAGNVLLVPLASCTSSTRPGHVAGRRIYETDTAKTYISDGTNWIYEEGPGDIRPWLTTTIPTNWLQCAGQSLLRSTYPRLFDVIGTTYGAADGTHFTLPDLRGRGIFGLDNMGGSDAGRLAASNTIGTTGGTETHTLTTTEMPSHTHGPLSNNDFWGGKAAAIGIAAGADYSIDGDATTGSAGSDGAHNNMPPYMLINWIIRTY